MASLQMKNYFGQLVLLTSLQMIIADESFLVYYSHFEPMDMKESYYSDLFAKDGHIGPMN